MLGLEVWAYTFRGEWNKPELLLEITKLIKTIMCIQYYVLIQINGVHDLLLKIVIRGWIDGLVVKSTDCSSSSHVFNSQQPHIGSQPSVLESDVLLCCV